MVGQWEVQGQCSAKRTSRGRQVRAKAVWRNKQIDEEIRKMEEKDVISVLF